LPDRRYARPAPHDYFGVDLALVWAAIEKDLPKLKTVVEALVAGA